MYLTMKSPVVLFVHASRMIGRYRNDRIFPSFSVLSLIQHAGPKLSGYPTSTATRVTVNQKGVEGLQGQVIDVLTIS